MYNNIIIIGIDMNVIYIMIKKKSLILGKFKTKIF